MVLGGHKEVQKMVLGCSKNSLEAPKSGRRGSKNGLKEFKEWSFYQGRRPPTLFGPGMHWGPPAKGREDPCN